MICIAVASVYIQGNAQDQLEETNNENQPLLKTRVTTEVVESSDSEEDDTKSQSEGQANAKNSDLVGELGE